MECKCRIKESKGRLRITSCSPGGVCSCAKDQLRALATPNCHHSMYQRSSCWAVGWNGCKDEAGCPSPCCKWERNPLEHTSRWIWVTRFPGYLLRGEVYLTRHGALPLQLHVGERDNLPKYMMATGLILTTVKIAWKSYITWWTSRKAISLTGEHPVGIASTGAGLPASKNW